MSKVSTAAAFDKNTNKFRFKSSYSCVKRVDPRKSAAKLRSIRFSETRDYLPEGSDELSEIPEYISKTEITAAFK